MSSYFIEPARIHALDGIPSGWLSLHTAAPTEDGEFEYPEYAGDDPNTYYNATGFTGRKDLKPTGILPTLVGDNIVRRGLYSTEPTQVNTRFTVFQNTPNPCPICSAYEGRDVSHPDVIGVSHVSWWLDVSQYNPGWVAAVSPLPPGAWGDFDTIVIPGHNRINWAQKWGRSYLALLDETSDPARLNEPNSGGVGYFTPRAKRKMLKLFCYASPLTFSLHTDHPEDDGKNEYIGTSDWGPYQRRSATFPQEVPEDQIQHNLEVSVLFRGVRSEHVQWLGVWHSGLFRGAVDLREDENDPGPMFGEHTGLLRVKKEVTFFKIEDLE